MMSIDCVNHTPTSGSRVNYIWLNPRDSRKSLADCATRLPLHYLERMYENAATYSDANFYLWLDFDQLSYADHFFLDSHRYIFDAERIKIRNLRDIPEYNDYPGFEKDSNIALYARADFARVLVLNHMLQHHIDDTIIYADLDCSDIKLTDNAFKECLEKYGLALGYAGKNRACNGYIALQGERGICFMNEHLLPRTEIAFQKNLVNHFGAFSKAVTAYRNKYFPDVKRAELGVVELPFMRTLMPYDEQTYEGVCPARGTRTPFSKELV